MKKKILIEFRKQLRAMSYNQEYNECKMCDISVTLILSPN